jgi:alpha-tubulin suppressor-like RCC1 family protein
VYPSGEGRAGPPEYGRGSRDGTLWAWGNNSSGKLGDGTTEPGIRTPLQVNLPGGVVAMDAGSNYSLAVKSDGTLWTWGTNDRVQLGDGTTTDRSTPGQLPGLPVKL